MTSPHRSPRLGQTVRYHHAGRDRAAMVTHVHDDGTTVDLVVFHDGDPVLPQARDAWARGFSVTVTRLDIPCADDDPKGLRCWLPLEDVGPQ